jgi:hypothetical protein
MNPLASHDTLHPALETPPIQKDAPRCAEIDEVEHPRRRVVQKVAPVGVGLHEAPAEELAQRQAQQAGADVVADGLVELADLFEWAGVGWWGVEWWGGGVVGG